MDHLFRSRLLTSSVNQMNTPETRVFDRIFRPRAHLVASDRIAFDVISGSEGLLSNMSVFAPAQVTEKTGRTTITMTAPRLAHKRFIHDAELNALRGYGEQTRVELLQNRIAREQIDMRAMIDRTLEFWACGALRGVIFDADLTTELVNYGLDPTHTPTLTGSDLWTDASSKPIDQIRAFKKMIEDDTGTSITGWLAYCGSAVMDALLSHDSVMDLLKYSAGAQIAETGRLRHLAEVEFQEYNGSFLDTVGDRKRFIEQDHMLLVGLCRDLTDCPYAPIIDSDVPGGVGNTASDGQGLMLFSKSWKEEDPSGRWIKVESRPLPVLQRPGAVVYAKVV